MPIINANGICIESFNELFNEIATQYRAIYGEDINLEQDSPDAQKISIFVKAYEDLQELGVDLYNSFDPDTAIGDQLNKLLKLCGISKRPATKSTVSITLTVSQVATIDNTYTLKDSTGNLWVSPTTQTLPIGDTTTTFIAKEFGAIQAQTNTITEFETIVLGIDSVTNSNSAVVGRDEETENDLRIRRKKSVALPSRNTVEGLNAKLLNLNGVIDASIQENDTDTFDTDLQLNSNSIWCIIDGGINEDIINTIGLDKMAGTGLKGSQTGIYQKELVRQDGSIRIKTVAVKYDRPLETNMYIKLDIKAKIPGSTLDQEAIKKELEKKLYFINEDATVTELYSYVYQANNNFIATNLQLSKDNVTYVLDELEAGYQEKFLIKSVNIIITEI